MHKTEKGNIYETGDVIRLKSGGPPMTVVGRNGLTISCQWFNESGELRTGDFPNFALEIVED